MVRGTVTGSPVCQDALRLGTNLCLQVSPAGLLLSLLPVQICCRLQGVRSTWSTHLCCKVCVQC